MIDIIAMVIWLLVLVIMIAYLIMEIWSHLRNK